MYLVEKHMIKMSDPRFRILDRACFLSKNLYNQALYRIRQHYFETKTYLSYASLCNALTSEHQTDYTALPRKVSQQTLRLVDQNFKSFFGALKAKNKGTVNHRVGLPRYLDKENGRQELVYTNQTISRRELKCGLIKLSGLDISIKTKHTDIQQVRVVHKGNHIDIEVLYKATEKPPVVSDSYMGVDLGLNNLATCGGNRINPFIINGKPLKSINHHYNKKLAKLKSRQDKCKNRKVNSGKIRMITTRRNNKVNDYIHKASRLLVNRAVSAQVSLIVIGHNKEWKQDISMGKRTNQNFVQIPFNRFVDCIRYKAELEGIKVVIREESYTSKASFIDNDPIPTYTEGGCSGHAFSGTRKKRGLYVSKHGKLINADLNGALNILRKEVPNAFDGNGIWVCSAPGVLTPKYFRKVKHISI